MAYAGVFGMLQTYKMMKADSDFKLINYTNELTSASKESRSVDTYFSGTKAQLRTALANATSVKNTGTKAEQAKFIKEQKDNIDYVSPDGEELQFSSNDIESFIKEVEAKLDEVDEDYQSALADIAAEEEVWQDKVDSEQTTNAFLQSNIDSFQQMLQSNIADAHTYGYQ